MSMPSHSTLPELQQQFREGSNNSMPIAGMICWAAIGIASLFVTERITAMATLYIMIGILPLAFALERLKGRNLFSGGDQPLTKLFLQSIAAIAIVIPVIVIAANAAQAPIIVVLGMALFTGAIWIPFGWAADDPVGMRRALLQAAGSYGAYALVPAPYTASAICAVVVACYVYVLVAAKPMGKAS